jgi:hypothetical protein
MNRVETIHYNPRLRPLEEAQHSKERIFYSLILAEKTISSINQSNS